MANKEIILQLLDRELDKLNTDHMDRISKLNQHIVVLKKEISELSNENRLLRTKVRENEEAMCNYKNKYEKVLQSQKLDKLSDEISYDVIDQWCVSTSLEDSVSLLSALNHFLEDKKLDKAIYIVQLLMHNPSSLKNSDPSIHKLFEKSLSIILTSELFIFNEEAPCDLYESYFELLLTLNGTTMKSVVCDFISLNFNDILDVIFYLRSPHLIVDFIKTCHLYQLRKEVPVIFHHIFEREWELIDQFISKDDFIVLFWYAFLYDLNEILIDQSSEILQWFDASIRDLSLYFYVYDCKNKQIIPSREDYNKNIRNFLHGIILSNREKEQIITKADTIIEPLIVNAKEIEKEEPTTFILESAAARETISEEEILSEELMMAERIEKGLDLLETYFLEKRFDDLERILNILYSDVSQFETKDRNRLFSFTQQLFNIKFEDITELDHLYKLVISLIKQIPYTYDTEMFLHHNEAIITDRILDLNDPYLISELAVVYFQFKLKTILGSYLNKVIDQWSFIDANIDERSFMRLFWIAFNQGLEKRFLKVLDESASFLKQDIPDVQLFSVFQDSELNPMQKKVLIEELKGNVKHFDEEEAKGIFETLDRRIKKLISKADKNRLENINSSSNFTSISNTSSTVARKMMYIVKLPNEDPVLPGTNYTLTEEWIDLAYFSNAFNKSQPKYKLVKVLSQNHSGKAYVTPTLLKEIKSKVGRNMFINVHTYEEKAVAKEVKRNQEFLWPSTEIKGNGPLDSNESVLNEVSDLKKLGYQITGSTKEKRWVILEKAVKQLGLRKVAYTIAQNVKLRKGQKNGEKKFSHAISEWEYDLAKLKKHYYRKEFKWPSTNIKK